MKKLARWLVLVPAITLFGWAVAAGSVPITQQPPTSVSAGGSLVTQLPPTTTVSAGGSQVTQQPPTTLPAASAQITEQPPTTVPAASAQVTQQSPATVPAGDVIFDSNQTGNYEIYLMTPSGTITTQLTDDSAYDSWWGRISPNREKVLFYRDPAGVHDTEPADNSLWEMNADGSDQTELIAAGSYGWNLQGHAEWSPNGNQLVMFGGDTPSPQIYITNSNGTDPVAVTNRGGSNTDPSWNPNGNGILFIGCPQSYCLPVNQEVYALSPVAVSGRLSRLTYDNYADYDPYYSPSGQQIAWLRNISGNRWSIVEANSNGSGQHYLINDGNINSKPAWSTNGSLIYFHRLVLGTDQAFGIWSIHSNGTGLTELLAPDGTVGFEYPGT
jgi:Tol biopolymer transport system component